MKHRLVVGLLFLKVQSLTSWKSMRLPVTRGILPKAAILRRLAGIARVSENVTADRIPQFGCQQYRDVH